MRNIQFTITLLLIATATFAQNTTSEAFAKSYTYEYNKEYSNAIASLDKVYEADSYETNLRLGWLYYLNANFNKSMAFYNNAIKLQPKSIEARLGLAHPLASLEKWKDLIKNYEKVLEIDEFHYMVNYRMALIYYNQKDFGKANYYGEKISALYPFNFNNNVLLGKINVSLGNITSAKAYLNKALLYNPSSDEVLGLLKNL